MDKGSSSNEIHSLSVAYGFFTHLEAGHRLQNIL